MLVTCALVSHNKPHLCHEAIQSVVNQSYTNWQLLCVDSGVLYDQGYFDTFPWSIDSRIMFIRSPETEETRKTKAMAPWCYNECYRNNLIHGDYIVYLCDDDILYPNAFQTVVSFFNKNPDVLAMYSSQDIGAIYPNGMRAVVGERRADGKAGKICNGRLIDCHLDYLQFAINTSLLDEVSWNENKGPTESHADGVFFTEIGEITPIYPVDIKTSQNRRTPQSTYGPTK